MVSESDAFRCRFVAHTVACCCVGMRAWCFFWLWCVLPQRLNCWARAVKAPVRFPLCAWLHCQREHTHTHTHTNTHTNTHTHTHTHIHMGVWQVGGVKLQRTRPFEILGHHRGLFRVSP